MTTLLDDAGRSFPAPYPLDNLQPGAIHHHRYLSMLLDRYSGLRVHQLLDLRGKRCLELGAGMGTYATWLAGQVGVTGHVLAVDKAPRNIVTTDQLAVVTRDVTELPLNLGTWDFIHARLLLCHLPQREEILAELVDCLTPDGVVFIEDWDASNTRMVLHARTTADRDLYDQVQDVMGQVFADAGTDRQWAPRIHGHLIDLGCVDVQTQIHSEAWMGASSGCLLVAGTVRQLWTDLTDRGVTETELTRVLDLLENDTQFVLRGHLMFSTSARKPATPADENASAAVAVADPSPVGAVTS